MSPHLMAWPPPDSDAEDMENEAAAIEKVILNPIPTPNPPQKTVMRFDGYISYADMQDLKGTMGDLLHRIVDFYIAFAARPRETSLN